MENKLKFTLTLKAETAGDENTPAMISHRMFYIEDDVNNFKGTTCGLEFGAAQAMTQRYLKQALMMFEQSGNLPFQMKAEYDADKNKLSNLNLELSNKEAEVILLMRQLNGTK